MQNENPFYWVILSILKDTEGSIGIYELMKSVENAGFSLLTAHDSLTQSSQTSSELELFRKNFVIMNALYQIRKDFADTHYNLSITPLNIVFCELDSSAGRHLTQDQQTEMQTQQALSDYYLDWCNFDSANQGTVDALLTNFWQRFTEYNDRSNDKDKRLCSLQILGVESDPSWENIQQAYRQKIAICHPDKGGSSHQFIEIREAFQYLKLLQNRGH